MVLVLCTSTDDAWYLYHVSRKYLKGFQSYSADMICILNFTNGYDSVKTVGGVTVLILCILSDDALYVYQVSRNYLKGFQKNRPEQ